MKLTFSVPLPPRELSPNARVHWTQKYGVAQAYKEGVTVVARLAKNKAKWTAPDKAKVLVCFVLPNHRRRDLDNLIAQAKPLIDALGPFREVRNLKGKVISAYGADILKDDNIKAVSLFYSAWVEKGASRVDVEIEA